MLPLQMMREKHPDWIVKRTISFEQACLGSAYPREYLAVSHRWETSKEPDIKGAQLKALVDFLNERPEILYVFYDLMCACSSEVERHPRIAALHRRCSPLVLRQVAAAGH